MVYPETQDCYENIKIKLININSGIQFNNKQNI